MKAQKIKTIKCKPYTKEDFDRDYERSLKRSVMFPTDFQKIEDAPRSTFDKEVQRKIAVEPLVSDVLGEKQKAFLQRMLETKLLSDTQKFCFRAILDGQRPIDIARELNITDGAVHHRLKRGIAKLKRAYLEKQASKNKEK